MEDAKALTADEQRQLRETLSPWLAQPIPADDNNNLNAAALAEGLPVDDPDLHP